MKEIRKIINEYDSIDFSNESAAIASVVNVEESSYRRIGARMLVRSTGIWIGGISGGCLEGDALKRSQKAIFKNKPSRVVYDTMDDDKNQIGVGLGCNGRIEVLFTPINKNDPNNPIEQLRKVVNRNSPSTILKIVEAKNADLLGKSQLLTGEEKMIEFCDLSSSDLVNLISIANEKKRPLLSILMDSNGAELKVLVEYIKPEIRLVIVGDNYDVNAFIGIANELGWEIHVVGNAKKLSKYAFGIAKKVYDYSEAELITAHDYTAVVLMSHDYNWDMKMLPIFMTKNPKYIGMLGPKKRMLKMQKEIPDLDLQNLINFYSPVGLDIGAESPEEIALSIASEIVATFRDREGTSLKHREGTIHERT